jgi:hypothetical protein
VEGCNQVLAVNKLRLYESVARALSLWSILILGGGLWAPAGAAVVSVVWVGYFLVSNYRSSFRPCIGPPQHTRIDWRKEIWPIQWRIGLSGVLLYFVSNCFTPIMFYYHGAAIAGKAGMTLALVTAVQGAAMAWLTPRRPVFGILVANRDYVKLDKTWFRTASSSVITLIVIGLAAWLLILYMNLKQMSFAVRFLPPLTTIGLVGWTVLRQISFSLTVYLRAHKHDPTAGISIAASVGSALALWYLGGSYGPGWAICGLVTIATASLVIEILIWMIIRKRWHMAPVSTAK